MSSIHLKHPITDHEYVEMQYFLPFYFKAKKSHTHFLNERKTFHIYPESLCKRDLEMSLRNFDYLSGFTIV